MPTYTQIGTAQVVGAGGAATIDFTSIPSTYTDLMILVSARSTTAAGRDQINLNFNGVTTNQTYRILYAVPVDFGVGSESGTKLRGGYISGDSATASSFGSCSIYIPNYAGSTAKSVSADGVSESNASATGLQIAASLWNSTAAITSISIVAESAANFKQYSTAYLYGVSNA